MDAGLVRMRFPGAAAEAAPEGVGLLPGLTNYILGRDPSAWVTGVPRFAGVTLRELRPGVDIRWHSDGGELEYDLHFAPGIDPATVPIEFDGADSLEIDERGDLLVRSGGAILRHSRPIAWQAGPEGRMPVEARFEIKGHESVGIRAGKFDPTLPLVVDPRITFSGYLGGNNEEFGNGLAVDSGGNVYLAGTTYSTNFPLQSAFQGTYAGSYDAFVSKFSASGGSLVYSTYIGGSLIDGASAIAVDSVGNAYVVGTTNSGNFPTQSPYQASLAVETGNDGFLVKLGTTGTTLAYSTYLGGTGTDHATGVAVDSTGAAFVAGDTFSANFPTTPGAYQRIHAGSQDAFVAKFSASGTTLSYSTFLGGGGQEGGVRIAIDASGAAYVAGDNLGGGFPMKNAFQATRSAGSLDVFAAKIDAAGAALAYSTYLGGDSDNQLGGIAVNSSGEAVVVGTTASSTFPLKSPIQGTKSGGRDAFVTQFGAAGTGLVFSTYLGGSQNDGANGVAIDSLEAVYVVGTSTSTNFPVKSATQATHGSGGSTDDGFVTKYAPPGTSLVYSTYLGGNADDQAQGVALDGTGAVVAGTTQSTNFPFLSSVQSVKGASRDGFVTQYITTPLAPSAMNVMLSNPYRIDLHWTDNSDNESAFEVQRMVAAGAFALVASLPPGTTDYTSVGLAPDTLYTFRVRAVSPDGPSGYSNEDSTQTPPGLPPPPSPPESLAAGVLTATSIGLAWIDTAYNEDFFELGRSSDGVTYGLLGTPAADATSFDDESCLPDRSYWYRLRATNAQGASAFSNVAVAFIPGTADLVVLKGRIIDSAKLGRDSLRISGTLALNAGSGDGQFDPQADGIQLRLGAQDGTPLLAIPQAAEGWALKNGVFTWKSPRGAPTKAKLTFNTATGALSVTVQKITFASAPASPVRLSITASDDAGHFEADWTLPTKGGQIKFPVPVPKSR